MRLIYRDDNRNFKLKPEAVDALRRIKGPIDVVSVCGLGRQGKIFILNQILGKSNGFKVASTHRLSIWHAPLKRTLDGTEYSLLLIDAEGIKTYDQRETYSRQIFSLTCLLSSMFI
ncbi:uncharacterized protein LOC111290891 [Durio zibethinus]|uniref:Uncharacterized protein LOC111290891 n=1 Tax=Durio zibethinus TaxID=66656 RepID=A0A6P5YC89_DURZI|nr:uncharacterized protein LOC111290891 [Durio zibethinus]